MPLMAPIPVGGFATELGSKIERLRALEAAQASAGISVTTVPGAVSVTALSGGGWQQPTTWPTVEVTFGSLSGALVLGGCTLIQQISQSVTATWFGVSVDGVSAGIGQQPEWSNGSNAYWGSNAAFPLWMIGYWPPVGPAHGAKVPLGTHSFAPQLSALGSGNIVAESMFLIVVPV